MSNYVDGPPAWSCGCYRLVDNPRTMPSFEKEIVDGVARVKVVEPAASLAELLDPATPFAVVDWVREQDCSEHGTPETALD